MESTSTYDYLFFSSPQPIPERVLQMIENGTVRKNMYVTNYYVILNELKIELSPPNFTPPIGRLIDTIIVQNPSINRKDAIQLAWAYRFDINRRLSLSVIHPDHLSIKEEQLYVNRIEWQPRLPKEYDSRDGVWLSFLVDIEKNAVIGTYSGFVETDDRGNNYSNGSFVELNPYYRGKGLCRDFARYSYSKVATLFNIQYFNISVGAEEQVSACRCYAQAAMDIGFNVYLDRSLIRDRSACSIFTTDPHTKMLLVRDG